MAMSGQHYWGGTRAAGEIGYGLCPLNVPLCNGSVRCWRWRRNVVVNAVNVGIGADENTDWRRVQSCGRRYLPAPRGLPVNRTEQARIRCRPLPAISGVLAQPFLPLDRLLVWRCALTGREPARRRHCRRMSPARAHFGWTVPHAQPASHPCCHQSGNIRPRVRRIAVTHGFSRFAPTARAPRQIDGSTVVGKP